MTRFKSHSLHSITSIAFDQHDTRQMADVSVAHTSKLVSAAYILLFIVWLLPHFVNIPANVNLIGIVVRVRIRNDIISIARNRSMSISLIVTLPLFSSLLFSI